MNNYRQLPTETLIQYIQDYQENFWNYWTSMGTLNSIHFISVVKNEIDKRINVQGAVVL